MTDPTVAAGTSRGEELTAVLARGVLWQALAFGFSRPTEETLQPLLGPVGRRVLPAAAERAAPGAGDRVGSAVQRVLAVRVGPLDALEERYDEIFGHTVRGRVCPFETEYGAMGAMRQPHELADIAGYYAAFGLRQAARTGVRIGSSSCRTCPPPHSRPSRRHARGGGPSGAPAASAWTSTRHATRSLPSGRLAWQHDRSCRSRPAPAAVIGSHAWMWMVSCDKLA